MPSLLESQQAARAGQSTCGDAISSTSASSARSSSRSATPNRSSRSTERWRASQQPCGPAKRAGFAALHRGASSAARSTRTVTSSARSGGNVRWPMASVSTAGLLGASRPWLMASYVLVASATRKRVTSGCSTRMCSVSISSSYPNVISAKTRRRTRCGETRRSAATQLELRGLLTFLASQREHAVGSRTACSPDCTHWLAASTAPIGWLLGIRLRV